MDTSLVYVMEIKVDSPCVLGKWVICLWQILNKIVTAYSIFSTFWDVFNTLPLEISVTKEFKRLVWYHCIFLLRL